MFLFTIFFNLSRVLSGCEHVFIYARGRGGWALKIDLQQWFIHCLYWKGGSSRTVLTVADGSMTGALVGIHRVCCPG